MPLSDALDAELDAHLERARQAHAVGEPDPGPPGTVRAEADGRTVEAEVQDCERIGATVGRVRVRQAEPGDVAHQAKALAGGMRGLGERLVPVEVEPELGGAVLRTDPEDMVDGRFWEAQVSDGGREAGIERWKVGADGQREAEPTTVTRESLRRLVDGLAEGLAAGGE
ncbi:MAG: hypothetical protein ABIO70_06125 [Pseudomonadota bacterium]